MIPTKEQEIETTQDISFFEFIELLLRNWRWIIVSLAITIGYAVLYLQKTPPVYSRTATVLITNDYVKSTESVLNENAQSNTGSHDVENEILFFKSNRIMPEVVRRLGLDVTYTVSGIFRDEDLYTDSPLTVHFLDARDEEEFMFNLTPLSHRDAVITNIFGKEGTTQQVNLGDTMRTPMGRIVVTANKSLTRGKLYTPLLVVKTNLENVASAYASALNVAPVSKDSRAININLCDVSAKRAQDVVNKVIEVYSEVIVEERNKIGVRTATFLNERIREIEEELSGVDYNIAEYKNRSQHLGENMLVEEKEKLHNEVTNFENQLSLAEYVLSYLVDSTKRLQIIPSNMGISDINIERQIDTYNELLFQRNKLISNSSERNPVILDLDNSLNSMKQTIIRSTENYIAGLDIKLHNARLSEEENLRRMAEVPKQQKYILTAQRRQKTTESLYLYLLNKREENSLDQLVAEGNVRVIDPATGSDYPVAPRAKFILLLAIVIGVSFPTGIIYLLFIFDTRVKSRKDIEGNLSVPFMGEIPFDRHKKNEGYNHLVVKENSLDPMSEAFRILRTNLQFMMVNTNKQVIMLSSLRSDSGKTFISCNLGMILALSGKKVAIVDLDIRKGTLSAHFKDIKTGVTNFLIGTITDPEEIIHPTGIQENLDVILRGPLPPNPTELLLSDKLEELVGWLRERYDYIILDSVPSNMVADARIINRVVDVTLYVIRKGKLDKRMLPEIEKMYVDKILTNMAIILNGVNSPNSYYSYALYKKEKELEEDEEKESKKSFIGRCYRDVAEEEESGMNGGNGGNETNGGNGTNGMSGMNDGNGFGSEGGNGIADPENGIADPENGEENGSNAKQPQKRPFYCKLVCFFKRRKK